MFLKYKIYDIATIMREISKIYGEKVILSCRDLALFELK